MAVAGAVGFGDGRCLPSTAGRRLRVAMERRNMRRMVRLWVVEFCCDEENSCCVASRVVVVQRMRKGFPRWRSDSIRQVFEEGNVDQ